MSEESAEMSSQEGKVLLHGYRITKLEESDEKQWKHISGHSSVITELRTTAKVLKYGVGVLLGLLAVVYLYVRGGWEAVLSFLTR